MVALNCACVRSTLVCVCVWHAFSSCTDLNRISPVPPGRVRAEVRALARAFHHCRSRRNSLRAAYCLQATIRGCGGDMAANLAAPRRSRWGKMLTLTALVVPGFWFRRPLLPDVGTGPAGLPACRYVN
jgi:hypothetical protein